MRFPVKSMLGESLDECDIVAGGVDGDRTHALVDPSTGKIASAKQPNLWRDLLAFSAKTNARTSATSRSETNPAGIIVSDGGGNHVDLLDPDFDAKVSEWLGRKVKLIDVRPAGIELNRARPDEVMSEGVDATVTQDVLAIASAAPGGGFFDFAPLHVMTSASLDATRAAAPAASIEAARYRPNIVIEIRFFPGVRRERMGRPPAPHWSQRQHRGDRADAALCSADAGAGNTAAQPRSSCGGEHVEPNRISATRPRNIPVPRRLCDGRCHRSGEARRSGRAGMNGAFLAPLRSVPIFMDPPQG